MNDEFKKALENYFRDEMINDENVGRIAEYSADYAIPLLIFYLEARHKDKKLADDVLVILLSGLLLASQNTIDESVFLAKRIVDKCVDADKFVRDNLS